MRLALTRHQYITRKSAHTQHPFFQKNNLNHNDGRCSGLTVADRVLYCSNTLQHRKYFVPSAVASNRNNTERIPSKLIEAKHNTAAASNNMHAFLTTVSHANTDKREAISFLRLYSGHKYRVCRAHIQQYIIYLRLEQNRHTGTSFIVGSRAPYCSRPLYPRPDQTIYLRPDPPLASAISIYHPPSTTTAPKKAGCQFRTGWCFMNPVRSKCFP